MTYRQADNDWEEILPDPFPSCRHEYVCQQIFPPGYPSSPYLPVMLEQCLLCSHVKDFPSGYKHPWA